MVYDVEIIEKMLSYDSLMRTSDLRMYGWGDEAGFFFFKLWLTDTKKSVGSSPAEHPLSCSVTSNLPLALCSSVSVSWFVAEGNSSPF